MKQKFINKSVRPPKRNTIYENREKREDYRPSTSFEVRIEVPYIEKHEKYAVKKLKKLLFDTVVKNRIYKEDDLQELFKHTREANSLLDYDTLESAIGLVYHEINS